MKSSASESKPFHSRSNGEIPGRARRKERLSRSKLKQAFLIDSDAELFMYLIQCIRFGSWKVRLLNRALYKGQQFFPKLSSCIDECNKSNYHIDTSVLLENILLVKLIKTTSGTRVVYFP